MLRSTRPDDVVILGAGASGTAVFIQLIREAIKTAKSNFSVTLLEQSGMAGPGLPYRVDQNPTLKVNDPALEMVLIAEEPDDFVRWVEKQAVFLKHAYPHLAATIDGVVNQTERFPPRILFGEYCRQRLQDYIEIAKSHGITVNLELNTAITTVQENADNQTFQLTTQQGVSWVGKNVVIAVGHFPSNKFTELQSMPHYYHSPWEDLTAIPKEASVAMLGSGLTAIDATKLLHANGHQGPMVMLSPSGALPVIKRPATTETYQLQYLTPDNINHPEITLEQCVHLFNQEISAATKQPFDLESFATRREPIDNVASLSAQIKKYHAGELRRWQFVMGKLWFEVLPFVWKHFKEEDKKIFMEKYHALFAKYGAGLPVSNGIEMLDLLNKGQLSILSCSVSASDIHFNPESQQYHIQTGPTAEPLMVDYIINGAGPSHDLKDNPLLDSMQQQGIITSTPFGGIKINIDSSKVSRPQEGKDHANLFALGPLTFGCDLSVYSVEESARRTQIIVNGLIKNIQEATFNRSLPFFNQQVQTPVLLYAVNQAKTARL